VTRKQRPGAFLHRTQFPATECQTAAASGHVWISCSSDVCRWARFAVETFRPTGVEPSRIEPATIHLLPGWNMIGTPFASPVRWDLSRITVKEPGGVAKALRDSLVVVSIRAWGWNADRGAYYSVSDSPTSSDARILEPWQGYFLLAYKECDLILPPP